ncbi:MAG: hypothetical protein A2600_04080 [Candidatus Lambdaproteobacteria bacterium RIFOXYD1_FULL_56_27]|uniref:Calcineurin-like phosphoesterase domain-containing protein n=1 Tax=Candidatus Lambdaproteobacteria bacterium RIFOXYD2_FULL_56_26 TaxID=1817773 RepID=A0A1F6H3H2_9PROT|nr:MAG: hypothetical protein A2426_01880 [Candidatus Lambdaproteobacteria bacterium RIFOXYC1_FULL_56_13]OGH04935.1 MAG: hypothetical protein A2557_08145 [Candidatus Lambdaproteobacteria bacterium RIFOXYD2_FULL_56_26]OGH09400.1 MAG: hypothetical protein A2600_04080 [Candidatus Lambdaproteobacteria bacterium RIFOXYD1_FULL_56_27]
MNLWAISDLHFSNRADRNMNAYGEIWVDHEEKIKARWKEAVRPADIVMIGGDLSWATSLEKAVVHLRQFNELPGRYKLLVKGNHDHWWKGREKLQAALPKGMWALQGTAMELEGQVFSGTRGWLAPNDPCSDPLDQKTFEKEMGLLKAALDQSMELGGEQKGIHLLLHFPPFTTHGQKTPFWELICRYPVKTCSYGHFHMRQEWELIPKGMVDGVHCYLTASDYIEHRPQLVAQ